MSVDDALERRGPDRPKRPRILVVDDSSTIRRILAGHLESAGYGVEQASDGRAALAACRETLPDLVLLDVDMPELDGKATLREMKADEALAGVPVLFLTAHSGGEDVAAGLELGAQDYLRKPCEPVELLARVSTALRMDQMQRQLQDLAAELDALSNTDPLTGVGNRRRFDQRLPALVTEGHARVGFILLDIDHFKSINDTHGHAIGDVTLRILAGRLGGLLEAPGQELFRWGGEEFVVLAVDADDPAVVALAESIRSRLASPPFAIDGGPVLHVTVSIGCVSAPPVRWEAAIEAADAALYEVKHGGRNAVRLAHLSG